MSLKSIYRNYIKKMRNKPQKVRLRKQIVGEWIEIFTKERKAVASGKLSKQEKNDIQDYWVKCGYGKIPLFWHRKYKAYSGKLDKRFFPEYLFTTKLEPIGNKDSITSVLSDKNLIDFIFEKALIENSGIKTPTTVGGCSSGFYFDNSREPVSMDLFLEIMKRYTGYCIIKPSVGESSGHGVRLLNLEMGGGDLISGDSIEKIIQGYGTDFIIQERLKECEDWAVLNPSSLNTVRIITYRVSGEIHATDAIMRIGRNGSYLDNAHAGGMYIAVNKDGTLHKYAQVYGFGNRYDKHPDSGIEFGNHKISHMSKVREAALKLHRCLPSIGFVNWDFIVNDEGDVVVIEANLSCGSVWLIQNTHGKGVFGDDTPEMIKMISK